MKTVFLIEDDAAIRENICELLELAGYGVIYAANGKNALALTKECKPDLILCDIKMPEVDGIQVFTELKQDPETASIPFIFITSSVEQKEVEKALAMGVQGYIRKPFDTDELFSTVNGFLITN